MVVPELYGLSMSSVGILAGKYSAAMGLGIISCSCGRVHPFLMFVNFAAGRNDYL